MLGGSSGAREREAEGSGAEALPAPPAIEFPADGSDPKYDGEGPGVPRRPSPCTRPPSFAGGQGGSEHRRGPGANSAGSGLEPAAQRCSTGGGGRAVWVR